MDNVPASLPAQCVPYNQHKDIISQIDDLLQHNVIEPSTSSYSSPSVTEKKKGETGQMCVDYCTLHAKTSPCMFPIPRIR